MRQGVRSQKSGVGSQKKLLFWILNSVFCILFFTGCAAKEEAIKPSLGYFDILPQMTRSKKVIEKLDSKLFVSATYKNWAFREAYIAEYARRYQMDDNEKEKLKEIEKDADEKFNEFFVAIYTPDERWNDFDQPQSIWKIYMEDEKNNRVYPIEIKKTDTNSPLIKEFYPYVDAWSSGYIIRFPKYMIAGIKPFPEENTNYFKLVITGVVGSAEMEWRLK